jgi:transcriptional regulator with XRE-family HTH domain
LAAPVWYTGEGIVPEWTFGDRLRKAREIAGLQQQDMASEFGVTSGTISNWETGRGQPRDVLGVAKKWANITGVQEHWILTGAPLGG